MRIYTEKDKLRCKNWRINHREHVNKRAKFHRDKTKRLKWEFVFSVFGHKCQHCGLESEFTAIYDIHHIDRTIKEVRSYDRIGLQKFKEYILKNKDKLLLLCANCHRIEHFKSTV